MNENIKKLLQLIKDNPELPIVPFVDYEVVGSDYGNWLGAWGDCRIDEYLPPRECDDPMLFRKDDDIYETLERYLPYGELDNIPDSEEEARIWYEKLPWVKAIIVYITTA